MAQQILEEEAIFQRIIFQECNQVVELGKLSKPTKQKLKQVLAQKIAYQAVYKPSYPQSAAIQSAHSYHSPSLMATLCCFLYPEDNRQYFEVTSSLFCKKVCHVFLFFRDDFLKVKDADIGEDVQSQPDLYGPLWLSITYIILLGISANLNNYFVDRATFTFDPNYIVKAIGFSLIFLLAEIMIYPAAVGCLDGQMSNLESTNLVGYSLILYLIPTILCVLPSQVWHIIMLLVALGLRFIFLSRNYCSRVDSKELLIYMTILAIQGLHFYLILSTFFNQAAGSSIDSGVDKVFHSRIYYQ